MYIIYVICLNQAHADYRSALAWFLEFVFVCKAVHVCLCMCSCHPSRQFMYIKGSFKQTSFIAFWFLYMTLAGD